MRASARATQDKQRFTSVSVATSPNSSRVLAMNIHGVLAGPPPFHSKRTHHVSLALLRSVFRPPSLPLSLLSPHHRPVRPRIHTSAPRGLVPIYHPLRYPSNGHQSKAEITIRVCPVDEVDGGVDGKANRMRERKRKDGSGRRRGEENGGTE